MKKWNEYKLNDLVEFPPSVKLTRGEVYPFIEMEDVCPGKRYVSNIQIRKYENSSCSKFTNNDVLLARITPCLENGKIAQVKLQSERSGFGSTEFFVFRGKKNYIDQSFLYYLTKCDLIWKSAVNSMVGASGRQRADADFLKRLILNVPIMPIQRKIAAVLSAYDDLIENNNRRIAILEKIAEELYREWFVRLRFPGHEKAKIVKGVPEGWKIKTVGKAFEFCGGGTPSTSVNGYWNDGNINWYSPTDLTAANAVFSFSSKLQITEQGLKESSARLFPAYSIMMTSRATIGQISINTTPACTNQGFITCIPNIQVPLYFLYYWLKLNKDYFIQISNGATFLELTKGKFKNVRIIIPCAQIICYYSKSQKLLFEQIELLLKQKDILTTTRDRLLTRLMSGKIDVEHLDIQFPENMTEYAQHRDDET